MMMLLLGRQIVHVGGCGVVPGAEIGRDVTRDCSEVQRVLLLKMGCDFIGESTLFTCSVKGRSVKIEGN